KTSGFRKPNPLSLINALPNMPAHYVSRFLQAVGPLNAPSTACASGTQSVGEASELIKNGRCDVVITGGVESVLQDYAIAGFEAMDALATGFNDRPRSEEHTSELQSRENLVCRLLLEKKKSITNTP